MIAPCPHTDCSGVGDDWVCDACGAIVPDPVGESPSLRPALVIAGQGRCGTSMVMALLDAGGCPVFGKAPGYEVIMRGDPIPPEAAGRALKLIAPQHFAIPRAWPIVYLTRGHIEQARSSMRMLEAMGERQGHNRRDVRLMARVLAREDRAATNGGSFREVMAGNGRVPRLRLRFEETLADPMDCAFQLWAVVREALGVRLDVAAAAAVVRARKPEALEVPAELTYLETPPTSGTQRR